MRWVKNSTPVARRGWETESSLSVGGRRPQDGQGPVPVNLSEVGPECGLILPLNYTLAMIGVECPPSFSLEVSCPILTLINKIPEYSPFEFCSLAGNFPSFDFESTGGFFASLILVHLRLFLLLQVPIPAWVCGSEAGVPKKRHT